MPQILIILTIAAVQLIVSPALAQAGALCNLDLRNAFGPFDYRNATREQIEIVESHHFTPQVESLIRGQSGTIGGDLDYTLRVFPNHPRALVAMARLARKSGTQTPGGSRYSVDCWFQRALEFQPDDPQVRLAYGVELLREGKPQQAIVQLGLAESLSPNNVNALYNLGLAYFELADYRQSLHYAKRAYALGFPLPGLRDKLNRVGKWENN